jgi:murein DD-endopeptidase MepM/ murein hydrolase activator NlpD
MNSRWRTTKRRLSLFISLVGLLILVVSLGGVRLAGTQNNLPQFSLVNNAVLLEDRLRLTANEGLQTGAAWLPEKQQVQDGFEATFQWQISRSDPAVGGEGFAFVIHNSPQPFPSIAVGEGRHGLGYQGIPNSLAVEFDTVQTPPADFLDVGTLGDPNDNHISVQTRGKEPNNANTDFSLGYTTTTPLLAYGSVHTAKVTYVPGTLTIFLDDLTSPVLSIPVDLGTTLSLDNGQAWIGFTAATGSRSQVHDILSFSFVSTPEPAPTPTPTPVPPATPTATPTPAPTPTPTPSSQGFLLPWDGDENPQYFTGGPHPTLNSATKSAIDFSGGTYQVLSIEAGRVDFSGRVSDRSRENKKSSGSWSGNVVVITHDNGIQSEYWHLGSIESTLTLGSRIPRGYPIGRPGCTGDGAKNPFGDKDGSCVNHLHLEFRRGGTRSSDGAWNRGTAVDVTTIVLDGWSIQAATTGGTDGQGSYDGTMTKQGEETRTADVRHCRQDTSGCNEIRNDLNSSNSAQSN